MSQTVVTIDVGGTGANNASDARNNLGVIANTGGTISGDLVVTGNLEVLGVSTSLNVEVLTIEDNEIVLNSNTSGAPTFNAFITIDRGSSTNTAIKWNEDSDEWEWTDNGTTYYAMNIARVAYAQANAAFDDANTRVLKAGDTMTGNLNVAAVLITQNVIPDANITYDLGSSTARYKDLWLSNSTIHLGEATISAQEGAVSFGNATVQLSNVTSKLNVTNDVFVSGNVGIGTTNPASKLHISGDDGAILLNRTNGNPYLFFGVNGDFANTAAIYGASDGLVFYTGTSTPERMRISSAGDVNIGLTGFAERLVIAAPGTSNNVTFWMLGTNGAGGQSNGVKLKALAGESASGAGTFTIETRSTDLSYYEHFRITSAGNVGIGTTNPGSYKLYVQGDQYISGTLTEASSIMLKENIDPITNALEAVSKLVGVTYDRKDGLAKNRAGLIAEEVELILPNVVNKDVEGNPSGIQYTNLIAYLIESIKELKAEIDVLKNK